MSRRKLQKVDLWTLTRMLRDRLDAIDGEIADAHHLLDEIEAVSVVLFEFEGAKEPPPQSALRRSRS